MRKLIPPPAYQSSDGSLRIVDRPCNGPDTELEGTGRGIQEPFGELSVIVEDQVKRASAIVIYRVQSQIGGRAETRIVRTGQKARIAPNAARIHVARIVDHHHPTFNLRTIGNNRSYAAERWLGISKMDDHNTRNRVHHLDPLRRKTATDSPALTNPQPAASRTELLLTRVITLGS